MEASSMIRSNVIKQAGVTLTELLVVLVIVSILATIAVPVYINKAENARIAVAQYECRQIADAEEACAAHHGFYVPLQLLNDMPALTGTRSEADSIDREPSAIFVIDPTRSFDHLNMNQPFLSTTSIDARVVNMIQNWQGPFLNPQRVYKGVSGSGDPINLTGDVNRQDYPLDPWGQPYRFYAPEPFGLIGSSAMNLDPLNWQTTAFSDGLVTNADSNRGYEKFAIVSYGPNGIPNTASSSDRTDDIAYFFGRVNSYSIDTGFNTGTTSTLLLRR
jgi:prepilin-type N-terminal cleavage/methylation domain-containing protein